MAVVRNLMIRIGADYSPAKKAMGGATRELTKFRRDTEATTKVIRGEKGLGGISTEYKNLGKEVAASLTRLRGAKGIGGVATELGTLVPLLGRSATAMRGLGTASAGAGARLAAAAGPIGIVAAALAAVAAASAAASQEAIKFESTIGRLNMQLKGGSREFMDWARAQGLAKQTAADLGATYGTILSSFISDNKELQSQTKNITQATRILVSGTGRPIEEVLERVRSGLLGNTEAIEDLGVFVNVAMIESTDAFKKFAGDKSWDQLDFRIQQQIRLAAILEQTYARYGNELQRNTMTKQSLLIEQFKDIKLNLSQAFLPVYDSVLPSLIRLAEGVANVTEEIARFMFALRGWDYDEMTRGTDKTADAVQGQAGAYDDLAKSAKKARGELAGFDELNLIGDAGTGSGSGGGGSGFPGAPGAPPGGPGSGSGIDWNLPPIPPLPKQRLEFDPPRPPDAGAGAVATAVTNTVNGLVADTKKSFADMWKDLNDQSRVDAPALRGVMAAAMMGIALDTALHTGQVGLSWESMLSGMLGDLNAYRPQIEFSWDGLNLKVLSMQNTTAALRLDWNNTLSYMQTQLNAYRPYIEWGLHLVSASIRNVTNPLADLRTSWESTLSSMVQTAQSKFSSIVTEVNSAVSALGRLQSALSGSTSPAAAQQPMTLGQEKTAMYGADPGRAPALNMGVTKESFVSSMASGLAGAFSKENVSAIMGLIQAEAAKPENKTAFAVYSSLIGGGQLAKLGAGAVSKVKSIWEGMKGVGNAIPAFGTGGAVYGPTLAMVGDNPGARHDPEIIAPESMIADIVAGENGEIVDVLRQILQAVREGKSVQAVIAEGDVGRAATSWINGESRRGRNPLNI